MAEGKGKYRVMAKILIVDDRPINLQYLNYVLTYASHTVVEAQTGREALETARNIRPDLIIADIMIPEFSGIQLVREIRNDPVLAKTPVIFYTAAYRFPGGPAIPTDCDVAAVLSKPADPKEVLSTVHRVLGLPPPAFPLDPGQQTEDKAILESRAGLRVAALIEVGLDLATESDVARLLGIFCRAARDICGADLAVVGILDGEGKWPGHIATAGIDRQDGGKDPGHVPDENVLRRLMSSREPKRFRGFPASGKLTSNLYSGPRIENFLGVPIVSEKRTYGAMYLCNKKGAGEFSSEDERLAVTLSAHFALTYENILLSAELRRSAESVETAKRRWETAYHESEERYEELVQMAGVSGEAVVIIQKTEALPAGVVLASPQWGHITGRTSEETAGIPFPDFFSPRYRDQIARDVRSWLEGKFAPGIHEVSITGNDREIPVLLTGSPSVYKGRPAAVCCIVDISERKAAEELKDHFIGMVSHEIKTPLTVIVGGLSTVLAEGKRITEDERLVLTRDAYTEAETLSDIVNNLLELSRAQASRIILHSEPLDMRAILEKALSRAKAQFPGHSFIVEFPAGLPGVTGDKTRVEHILYNLLDNAAKFSPEGAAVRVSVRALKKELVIGVADQGPGISEEDQARLFTPFERLHYDSAGSTGGTGLGLVVCRKLVEAHGGRIWIESKPGKGSTFFFTLPLKS